MTQTTLGSVCHKPIFGGPFGKGGYALVELPRARSDRRPRHVVIDSVDGRVLSVADSKLEALAGARKVLVATEQLERIEAQLNEQAAKQHLLFPPEAFAQPAQRERARPVSKRRRDVFAKCSGRCQYCHAVLKLDGSWHVEHAFPKALGGLDEIGNLFAACQPCNLAKRDRTAFEFVAGRVTDDET